MGISYAPAKDTFFCEKEKLKDLSEVYINTKRQMLATLPRLFDPLQLLSPVILKGRLLFSECCANEFKLGWDDPLPDHLKRGIQEWQTVLTDCAKLEISRWLPFPHSKKIAFY